MKQVPLKEEFKSRTKFDKFNIKKEEFYVFGLWLEIFKDQKGIHICVNKKELDEIYERIYKFIIIFFIIGNYILCFLHLFNFFHSSDPSVSIFPLLIIQFVPLKKITNSVKL